MVPWTRVYEQLPWRPQGTEAAVNSDEMCGLLRSPKEICKCTHAFVKHCRVHLYDTHGRCEEPFAV